MSIVRAADAPRFELGDARFTVFAGPSNGSRQVCAWRLTVPAGLESNAHTVDRDEVFVVLSGQVRITPGGDLLGPGDSTVVPAGAPISVGNPGAEAAEVYVALQAGFTAYQSDGTSIGTPPWAA
ncbi:cupin domain-containing protein [Dactylosporangium fulvum]|uniref:Cupin domain-containing protein n=1 Tax=Dactylosporangium fulvum TaxID=53359 RepID=A0ABY5W5T6_9ACTN|nr:cupin domain-containing protein [Dactylosporangium fulvum]UWP84834.1 cupin domain-containing protein [Dactylosporangium fulvum]